MDEKERIRELNDHFRKTGRGGSTVITLDVQALPLPDQIALFDLVRAFNAFSADNDPYGEHNFGIVGFKEQNWYWRIDYYDPDRLYGSEDPADPTRTARVMTIMHSSEY